METRATVAEHPVHPMLIPFPIALWIFSLASDLIYLFGFGGPVWKDIALYTMVGGIVGGTIGAAAEPPREVYTYVEHEKMPSVTYRERVVVGEPLGESVVVRRVPQHDEWGYAVVNNRRVIVDNRNRKVVKIID